MKKTTVCYIEHEGKTLMLHRTKKKDDLNYEKFIGVGGKINPKETPLACILREVFEETGLILNHVTYHGIVWFVSNDYEEEMHLYTSHSWSGTLKQCDEGDLVWVKNEAIKNLNLWEGDLIFHKLIKQNEPFFQLKLVYKENRLDQAYLNGLQIEV